VFNASIILICLGSTGDATIIGAFGIATSFYKIVGMSTETGLALGIGGDLAQNIGAGNLDQCSVIMNRARFMIVMFMIPLAVIGFNAGNILHSMGIPSELCEQVQIFMNITFI